MPLRRAPPLELVSGNPASPPPRDFAFTLLPDHMAEHEQTHREFMEQAERDHQEHVEAHQGFMEQAEQDHQDHHHDHDMGW